jgi:uncharacterized protein with HEPN domain
LSSNSCLYYEKRWDTTDIKYILAAIERIQRYCADAKELALLENEMLQDAVIRNFELIGEVSKNIDHKFLDFMRQHPSPPLIDADELGFLRCLPVGKQHC